MLSKAHCGIWYQLKAGHTQAVNIFQFDAGLLDHAAQRLRKKPVGAAVGVAHVVHRHWAGDDYISIAGW